MNAVLIFIAAGFALGVLTTITCRAAWRWAARQFTDVFDDLEPGRLVHGRGAAAQEGSDADRSE